jgi:hypothetical protein
MPLGAPHRCPTIDRASIRPYGMGARSIYRVAPGPAGAQTITAEDPSEARSVSVGDPAGPMLPSSKP